jgi:recombination protein RecR
MSDPLASLTERLEAFPGIGGKTATRMAYWLLKQPVEWVESFAAVVRSVKLDTKTCVVCCAYSKTELCEVCEDASRVANVICVVATTEDMRAFVNNVPTFKGSFHVLQGVISPTEGRGPESVRVLELLKRLHKLVVDEEAVEVILALDGSIESTATCLYISKLVGSSATVSKIAFGLAAQADITNADAQSLTNALENRRSA